jgi:hypothetical protein
VKKDSQSKSKLPKPTGKNTKNIPCVFFVSSAQLSICYVVLNSTNADVSLSSSPSHAQKPTYFYIHTHQDKNASSSPDHHHWWVAAASSSIFAKWGIDYVTHRYGGESTPSWKMNKWKYCI